MPLTESTASPKELAETLKNDAKDSGASSFVAVYASHVPSATAGGQSQSWCGDCIAAEPLVEKKFGGKFGEKCWVVWAGDKTECVFFCPLLFLFFFSFVLKRGVELSGRKRKESKC